MKTNARAIVTCLILIFSSLAGCTASDENIVDVVNEINVFSSFKDRKNIS